KIPPPESQRDDIDLEVSAIIMQALSIDRRQRFQSCTELAEALGRYRVRVTALESATTVARYLKTVLPSGSTKKDPHERARAARNKETKILEEQRQNAQRAANESLSKNTQQTQWERLAAHYLRSVIDEPNVWKLIELADKARARGMEDVA